MSVTDVAAVVYILSGICQPLLVQVCKDAGLADPSAQLYMLFYYAGPSCLLLTLLPCCHSSSSSEAHKQPPSWRAILKASLIACFDISAQSLNYTGASMAGATIFAVVYSSVTVWTAVFSRLFLGRSLSWCQWGAVLTVFGGLCITAADSISLGQNVSQGTALVVLGSCMHGATYVMSEAVMAKANDIGATNTSNNNNNSATRETLSVRENSAFQGVVACMGLLLWQLVYTSYRWDELIGQPMQVAGTTVIQALWILSAFGLANLVHSFSFYHTLAHYPGGSTSAGVMKGLQAVLVFVAAHLLYCGRPGGDDAMCFSVSKFLSLVTVVGGVTIFSLATERSSRDEGYSRIGSVKVEEIGLV